MLRCAVLDDYQAVAEGLADWTGLAPRVEVAFLHEHLGSEDAVAARLKPFEILVVMRERTPFPASLIARLPNLRLIVTTGMRNAAVDFAAAKRAGITICGTIGVGRATGELTFALILAAARHLPTEFANMRAGRWQTTVGMGLAGRRLGIIGLGNIGRQVAGFGRAFGMEVTAWSRRLDEAGAKDVGVARAETIEAVLAGADVISIHLALNAETRGLIGRERLALLRPDAILVNTSRGPIVDQQALLEILREKRIRAAAVDVYETEPLPPDHPFRHLDNLVATPHLGYVAEDNLAANYAMAVADIAAWLDGAPVRVLT